MQNHRKILGIVVFLAIFVITNSLLNFALIPSSITRVIMHEIEARDDYKCAFLGTSHGSYGIDSDIVSENSGVKSINLCMGGEYIQDSYYLLKRVFETNTPDVIVYEMDFEYLVNVPKNNISASYIYNAYPFSLDKISYFKDKILSMDYRAAIFPWIDNNNFHNAISIIKTKLSSEYINYSADAVKMKASNVYMGKGFIYRLAVNNTAELGHLSWDESKVDQGSLKYFKKIVNLCKSKNTKIIMISMPIPKEQLMYSIDKFDEAYTYVSELAASNNIEFYNFNLIKDSVFSRTMADYNDYDGHMHGASAQKFSKILGNFMKDVESGQVTLSDYFYDTIRDIQ